MLCTPLQGYSVGYMGGKCNNGTQGEMTAAWRVMMDLFPLILVHIVSFGSVRIGQNILRSFDTHQLHLYAYKCVYKYVSSMCGVRTLNSRCTC